MQLAYDANHDRAFQLIFGQYLSWYLTYVGDYDGARSAFRSPSRRRPTMDRRCSAAPSNCVRPPT
jgi:hypothetical protein